MIMILIAIALLRNMAEKNEKIVDLKIVDSKLDVKEITHGALAGVDCNLVRFKAYSDARSSGLSHEDATGVSYNVYFHCMMYNLTTKD